MRLILFRDNWEQLVNFAVFNPEIKLKYESDCIYKEDCQKERYRN